MRNKATAVLILLLSMLMGTAAAHPRGPAIGTKAGPSAGRSTAAEIVVNSADDTQDGSCDTVHCSLRDALAQAGDVAGPKTIVFDIPTSDPSYDALTGVWTLQTDGGYFAPDETTIDGSVPNGPGSITPGIEIDASTEAQYTSGLRTGSSVTLRGLVVNGFGYAVWIDQADVTVEGCYIGTDPTGTLAKPNSHDGILLARGATGAVIQGNVISGNRTGGIRMFGDPTEGHVIHANRIGCAADGVAALPNGRYGIKIHDGAHDNTTGPDNVISFNGTYGIWVTDYLTHANTITQNSIHSNEIGGIYLTSGGNDELDSPLLLQVSRTEVVGSACANCVIEVFSDAWDQGEIYEGTVTADGSGAWSFTAPAELPGLYVTATATDEHGSTSQFSEPVRLPPPATPTATRTATLIATLTATRTSTSIATSTATATRPGERLPIYLPIIGREWR